MFFPLFEALVIACALSLDAFVASFAYGSKGIKMPARSVALISLICTGVVGLALLAGTLLRQYIPYDFTVAVSFTILFGLGALKLADNIIKSLIRRHDALSKEIKFSLSGLKFILKLYADPEQADVDGSKTLSPGEAATLALALSLDGLAVGLGAAIGSVNSLFVLIGVLVTGVFALLMGGYLGNKAARKVRFDLSWLSGVLLILLAFSNLW
ncbi:MAG: manganese efflux pump [Oscillospiraceae bacterium]|nr:manganese efflux pump [Oscillospiraceae bacterium]